MKRQESCGDTSQHKHGTRSHNSQAKELEEEGKPIEGARPLELNEVAGRDSPIQNPLGAVYINAAVGIPGQCTSKRQQIQGCKYGDQQVWHDLAHTERARSRGFDLSPVRFYG